MIPHLQITSLAHAAWVNIHHAALSCAGTQLAAQPQIQGRGCSHGGPSMPPKTVGTGRQCNISFAMGSSIFTWVLTQTLYNQHDRTVLEWAPSHPQNSPMQWLWRQSIKILKGQAGWGAQPQPVCRAILQQQVRISHHVISGWQHHNRQKSCRALQLCLITLNM